MQVTGAENTSSKIFAIILKVFSNELIVFLSWLQQTLIRKTHITSSKCKLFASDQSQNHICTNNTAKLKDENNYEQNDA